MKTRDLYVIGLGALHVVLFSRLILLAEQVMSANIGPEKHPFVIIFGALVGVAVFVMIKNIYRIIELIPMNEVDTPIRIVMIAKTSVVLLSLILITALLKSFILFR